MNKLSLKILNDVAKTGELPLLDALTIGAGRFRDHRDQFPLALLIQDEYLGFSLARVHLPNTELMREFTLAVELHMFTLPKDASGIATYTHPATKTVKSSGAIDPADVRVFLKAKGALYLEEASVRHKERWFAWMLAVGSALVGALLSSIFGG